MPGFRVYSSEKMLAPNEHPSGVVGISQTIFAGDPVVMTNKASIATLNSVNMPSFRSLLQADITALYKEGTAVVGITGVAAHSVKTDANAIASSQPPTVVTTAGPIPIYPAPSVSSVLEPEYTQGRARMRVQLFDQNSIIGGWLWENTTITDALVGTRVGILISTIGGVPFYFWSTGAATTIGVIARVNQQDPMYNQAAAANTQNTTHNPRGEVLVNVDPAYQQFYTNQVYATN